jgi:hypothetical protein
MIAMAALLGFTSLAWAQQVPPGWGEPDAIVATLRHARFMTADPLFFILVIASILVGHRFFYWVMLPTGGVAGVVAVALGLIFTDQYNPYFMTTPPFWAAAFLLGLLLALVGVAAALIVMIVAQRLGAEE